MQLGSVINGLRPSGGRIYENPDAPLALVSSAPTWIGKKLHFTSLFGRCGRPAQGIYIIMRDFTATERVNREYPLLKLTLRAPIELENLLPYDIQYKVFDKDTNQSWNSFLRKGGNTPVHSVDLSHLVLLSVKIQDCGTELIFILCLALILVTFFL